MMYETCIGKYRFKDGPRGVTLVSWVPHVIKLSSRSSQHFEPLTCDDDARKRTEEGEGYSGIPVCREFPNENPNIYDSLAYSTLE
ncbi:hypothetical protein M8J77_025636 [Diaphorina citri]|nr:hypothetical protein M8J77_025636 [Diaphorina citri]